jgi:hypothetical protein
MAKLTKGYKSKDKMKTLPCQNIYNAAHSLKFFLNINKSLRLLFLMLAALINWLKLFTINLRISIPYFTAKNI